MKKTLLALSVMVAASSANAGIEVYNNEGVTVNLKGDIEVVYVQDIGVDKEFTQEIQDADFGFDVRYAVNDEFQFGGYWEFDGASGDVTDGKSSSADVGDVYVAMYSQSYGSIKFGRTCGALDDAGVGSDFQFGVTSFFNNKSSFCADEMARYDIDTGMFYGTLALAQDKKSVDQMGKDGSYLDLKAGVRVADFDFTAYYGDATLKNRTSSKTSDVVVSGPDGNYTISNTVTTAQPQADDSILGLEARFAGVENLNLEIGYYLVDFKEVGADKVKADTIALAADYTIDAVTIGAGYSVTGTDVANSKDKDNWFVNAGYGFAPNTTAYVEVGGNDVSEDDTGFAVGVKASF
ncbi:porin [Vibrio genomosp. F10 str. 9ZC157]|uniref:Porin domain-containing protein n=1 Tax=Vibrio genomosp. F10 str. ZF-129 TaxID=1187848 RepID=A0A1E5BFB5_9VIBR|nr:porin [Vibrio genomosp. F10]OEE33880.1 hypothetical protein A1QO_09065 [Vibrio genomosp. F10 str. ZF-129]OEE97565.1 hypothetical protein A1QM_14630 [Vibrio genomosp. F10 str. 9ZC157]